MAWKTGVFPKWLVVAGFVVAALEFFGGSTPPLVVPVVLAVAWLLVASVILATQYLDDCKLSYPGSGG